MGRRPRRPRPCPPARTPVERDPDLDRPIAELIFEVVPDPGAWLVTPNPQLFSEPPLNLIGTDREWHLRDLLRAAKQGYFS